MLPAGGSRPLHSGVADFKSLPFATNNYQGVGLLVSLSGHCPKHDGANHLLNLPSFVGIYFFQPAFFELNLMEAVNILGAEKEGYRKYFIYFYMLINM